MSAVLKRSPTRRWLGAITGAMSLCIALQFALTTVAQAQSNDGPPLRQEINKGVVEIMGTGITTSAMAMASDIARTVTDGNELRVIANVGLGSIQGVQDLLYLRGIDVALVNAAVLDFFREKEVIPGVDLDKHIRYLSPIYSAEFHIIARDDIRSIEDLEGRKVNFGTPSAGTNMAASVIFGALGISPQVVNDGHPEAIRKLRNGEIDALSIITGKPWKSAADMQLSDGLHFLDIPSEAIAGSFYSAELTAEDYPSLIEPGETVSTVASDLILAVYNWPDGHPRRANLERFAEAYFDSIDKLRSGETYHKKWRELDPYRDVPGWQRFETTAPGS